MTDKENINRVLSDFKDKHYARTKIALTKFFSALSEEEIEDIMQEALIVLWNSIAEGKVDKNLYPYYYQTCKNLCLKAVRSKGPYLVSSISDDDDEDFEGGKISMTKVDMILSADNEDESERQVKIDKTKKTLDKMTERCRNLLERFYSDKLSWAEIARLENLKNAQTAKAAASRCRQTFKEKFNS